MVDSKRTKRNCKIVNDIPEKNYDWKKIKLKEVSEE